MNYLNHSKKIVSTLLGIGVVVAVSYAFAGGVWNAAPANPPANNTPSLIDTSTANQIKQQGGLSVAAFSAYENALFAGPVYLNGMVRGGTPTTANSVVSIGGTDPSGVAHTVATAITGGFSNTGTVQSGTLAQGSAAAPICADTTGTLVICSSVAASSSSSTTTTSAPFSYPPVYLSIGSTSGIPATDPSGNATTTNGVSISIPNTTLSQINANVTISFIGTTNPNGSSPGAPSPAVTPSPGALQYIENQFTAEAKVANGCASIGKGEVVSFSIPIGSTQSSVFSLPADCAPYSVSATITTYSPQTTIDGRPVVLGASSITI